MSGDSPQPVSTAETNVMAQQVAAESGAGEHMQVEHVPVANKPENANAQTGTEDGDDSWSFIPVAPAAEPDATNTTANNDHADEGGVMEGVEHVLSEAHAQGVMDTITGVTNALADLTDTVQNMGNVVPQDQVQRGNNNDASNGSNGDGDDQEDLDNGESDGEGDDNQVGNNNNVPNTDHFVWVNRGDAVEESPSCKLCMTDPDPIDALYVECGHVWCKDCLNQYFAQVFTNRDQFPPRCCRAEGFDLGVIQMHLDDEVLLHVMEKWEEWSTEDPTYCANIQCRTFIPADQVDGQWATCLLCKVKTCVECQAKKALHLAPDQHPAPVTDRENNKLAEKEGWKYCPNKKCNKLVEKIDGCDTMTCKCGQQFCYRCGSSFDGPFPCNCAGQNAWVGQVQQWANGNDGNQGDREEDDGSEDDEDEEAEVDEAESESSDDVSTDGSDGEMVVRAVDHNPNPTDDSSSSDEEMLT